MQTGLSDSALRRRAQRLGYRVRKSRWRKGTIDNLGEFMLLDVSTNVPIVGFRYDADLEEIADWLSPD